MPDKRDYVPGDTVKLQINTDRVDTTVLLFVRPANGVYLAPRILRLNGKSTIAEITVAKRDMPNFFVEAITVSDGKVHSETKEILVPPEKRVVNVDVLPSAATLQPGEEASIQLRLTDFFGKPVVGSTVVSVYDKSVESIAGGSNIGDIRAFFWKWRRRHQASTVSSLDRYFHNRPPPKQPTLQPIGIFGAGVANQFDHANGFTGKRASGAAHELRRAIQRPLLQKALAVSASADAAGSEEEVAFDAPPDGSSQDGPLIEPTVRSTFADTALWIGALETDDQGLANITLQMPENLTTWKIGVWSMSHGTKVGMGSAEIITRKNLIVRLQAPRYFVEKR